MQTLQGFNPAVSTQTNEHYLTAHVVGRPSGYLQLSPIWYPSYWCDNAVRDDHSDLTIAAADVHEV